MKLIRKKSDNSIHFMYPDSATITFEANQIKVENPNETLPVQYLPNFISADYDEVTGADIPTTWYPDGVLSHDGSAYGVADATKKATWDKYYADCVTYGDKVAAGTATDDDIPVFGS
tara:strand:- start:89 stop:439 length:351 start_codon:yes stop_codon:yes gene_type:complete